MTDYLTDFVQESEERITELNNALLTLERDPTDDEAMENIFRVAHTLKGNCGAMGLESASDLAHAIEDLLDAVRSGDLEVTAELMDVIFDAVDELEVMIDEVAADGEIETDPSETIERLRSQLDDAGTGPPSIDEPSTDEIDSVLRRFEPPANDEHDAYLVRLAIAEREGVNNGKLVLEALIDAFDLIGTDPPRSEIEADEYGSAYDAVFGSAVGEAAIRSGLEPVEEVAEFELVNVSDRFEALEARKSEPAGEAAAEPGADISAEDAAELEVDELLDEFDEFDDLDALVEEVDDDELKAFEDMGEAGSFDDLLDDEEIEDEPGEPPVDPLDEEAPDETEAEAESAAADSTATDSVEDEDEEIEDANAVFNELKNEVEMVGFDELQEELEELEFDEFDSDDEVGMDELIGDDVDVDDSSFLERTEPTEEDVDDILVDADDESAAEPAETESAGAEPDVDGPGGAAEPADVDEADETELDRPSPTDLEDDAAEPVGEPTEAAADASADETPDGESDVDEPTAVESESGSTPAETESSAADSVGDGVESVDPAGAEPESADESAGPTEPADDLDEPAETDEPVASASDDTDSEAEPTSTDELEEVTDDGDDASEDVEAAVADDQPSDEGSPDADLEPDQADSFEAEFETEFDPVESLEDEPTDDGVAEGAADDALDPADDPFTADADELFGTDSDDELFEADSDGDLFEVDATEPLADEPSAADERSEDAGERVAGDADVADEELDGELVSADADVADEAFEAEPGAAETDEASEADEDESVDEPVTADPTDDGSEEPVDETIEADSLDESLEDEPSVADETIDEPDALEAADEPVDDVAVDADAAFDETTADSFAADSFDSTDESFETTDDEAFDASLEADEFAEDSVDELDDAFGDDELDDAFSDDEFDDPFDDDEFDDAFAETDFGDDDGGFDSSADPTSVSFDDEFDDDDRADGKDDEPETVIKRIDEPTLRSPDITVPETLERPDADQQTDEIQSVRVDVEQIDSLLTLVEGLVTSRVRLRHTVNEREDTAELEKELDNLVDLTTDLQETVMDIRLVPLRTVTNRLPRVVRDIARDQGKEVAFEMTGENVELDRSILDRIGDPLIHLVRNAVDHGVEPPEKREAEDKPREGTVEVHADRSRDRVTITVADDGSGLDPDRLRDAAVDAEIVTEDEAEEMPDEEVYELIFHPGLTTADEVTDVSGRGVGMDVVKRTIEDFDGSVSIDSDVGEGTTITMTLPVSVAIDDILFVESGGEEFGIPTKAVQDIEPAESADAADADADDDYSVVRLDDALETPRRGLNGEGMAVRIRDDVRPVLLHCDHVHGQQEVVVKPFEGFMSDIPGLSGATVRGRGEVVNILDVTTL